MPIRTNIHNMPQGPPNPGFMQEKVQKGDFLKKPLRELKFVCCFRFLRISRRPGTLNWKWLVFLLSKILYKQCAFQIFLKPKNLCTRTYFRKPVCLKAGATETNLLTKFIHTICKSESERGGQYNVRLFVHGWLATSYMKYGSCLSK